MLQTPLVCMRVLILEQGRQARGELISYEQVLTPHEQRRLAQ
jgi:hypothetical protein